MAKDYRIKNGKVLITEVNEVTLDSMDIEMQLQAIAKEKLRLMEQNRAIVDRYNGLVVEENNLKNLIFDIGASTMEIINPETGEVVRNTGEINV